MVSNSIESNMTTTSRRSSMDSNSVANSSIHLLNNIDTSVNSTSSIDALGVVDDLTPDELLIR